jgi:hypothetical protein
MIADRHRNATNGGVQELQRIACLAGRSMERRKRGIDREPEP